MHDFLYKEADGRCNWQQSDNDSLAEEDARPELMPAEEQKVEEEEKDELLDRIMIDIENAQSDESDSDSESEDEPPAQEPNQFIKENLNKETVIKFETEEDEEQEFSDDSFDEQDLEEERASAKFDIQGKFQVSSASRQLI